MRSSTCLDFALDKSLDFPLDFALDGCGFSIIDEIKALNPLLASDPLIVSSQIGRPIPQRTVRQFNGVDQSVDLGAALIPATGDFEIEAEIKIDSLTGTTQSIISQAIDGVDGRFIFFINSSNNLSVFIGDAVSFSLATVEVLQLNIWYTVAVKKEIGVFCLYIDGDLKTSASSGLSIMQSVNTFVASYADGSRAFDGSMSLAKVNGRICNLAEGSGNIAYDTSGNNHGTYVNNPANTLQDVNHSNLELGFSLYEHATLDPIRVPYGINGNPLVITPPTGYTLTADRPAITDGHNSAETLFDLRTADDGQKLPAVNLATPALPDTYTFGDLQTENFRFRVLEGGTDRFLAFSEVPSGSCLNNVTSYTGGTPWYDVDPWDDNDEWTD
jgi:hypothetical protein